MNLPNICIVTNSGFDTSSNKEENQKIKNELIELYPRLVELGYNKNQESEKKWNFGMKRSFCNCLYLTCQGKIEFHFHSELSILTENVHLFKTSEFEKMKNFINRYRRK